MKAFNKTIKKKEKQSFLFPEGKPSAEPNKRKKEGKTFKADLCRRSRSVHTSLQRAKRNKNQSLKITTCFVISFFTLSRYYKFGGTLFEFSRLLQQNVRIERFLFTRGHVRLPVIKVGNVCADLFKRFRSRMPPHLSQQGALLAAWKLSLDYRKRWSCRFIILFKNKKRKTFRSTFTDIEQFYNDL